MKISKWMGNFHQFPEAPPTLVVVFPGFHLPQPVEFAVQVNLKGQPQAVPFAGSGDLGDSLWSTFT